MLGGPYKWLTGVITLLIGPGLELHLKLPRRSADKSLGVCSKRCVETTVEFSFSMKKN